MADTSAPLTKRFFERAALEETDGGFALALDERRARTPARAPLIVPTRPLGEAIVAEWDLQGATIDPRTMPLTRMANSAIDGVAREADAVRADLMRYAGSDLVIYRAGAPDGLVAAQAAAWDPVLAWAKAELGARFILVEGVMFSGQPEPALARIRETLERETSPFRLAPLHVMTTLTGSVLITLMHAADGLDAASAWEAAHVDELHQERFWGRDEEAFRRREHREAEFRAAATFLALTERP